MSTPVPQDLFSRFMAAAFDEHNIIGCSTAFQTFFGNPANGSETIFSPDSNQVDIDIIRGNERIAALIPRGSVSRSLGSLQKDVREGKFTEFSRKFPLAEEEGNIDAGTLINRIAGENVYQRLDRLQRMRLKALKLHQESIRRIVRMDEVLAAQSVLTGKQDAIIGTSDTNLQYDFRRNSTHTATTSTSWSGGSGTIMADIDAQCAKGRANGHVSYDIMVLGTTAMTSFINDTKVAAQADNRRYEFVNVGMGVAMPPKYQRLVDGGMIFQGRLRTPAGYELYLFTYVDGYTAANGTFTPYMPVDKVLFAASSARCDRYFGPPENLPQIPMREQLYRELFGFDPSAPPMPPAIKAPGGVIVPQAFYCDAYVSADWKRVTIRTQHAPIFATTQTDAFVLFDTEP